MARLGKQTYVWLERYVPPSLLAAAAVCLITVMALFVPPYIGMADNGDYFRMLYGNGLYFNAPDYDSQYFGYFVREYGIFQFYNESGAPLFSSQSLFIQFALWINKFFDSNVFDLRVLGAVYTVLYTCAVYLLVESLTWRIPGKFGYPIAALAVFIFGDTGYTAYFNSFFGESVVLIMMLLLIASGLLLYRGRYNDYVLLAVFFLSALFLTTSKQQNAPVGILVGMLGVFIVFIRRKRSFRVWTAGSLVVLIMAGIGTYALIPKEFVNINQYHAMTRGILKDSKDPEDTLGKFGIDKQYAILNESIYYELYTTVDVDSAILEDNFYSRYGFGSILAFYITHPDKTIAMLDLAAKSAFKIRPPAMGNYEKSENKPFRAQTTFFSGYNLLKASLAPKTFGFITIWIVVIVGLYLPAFVTALRARQWRHALRLPLIAMMILMGLSGIFVSIIGAGDADLSKHEFLFTAAFDIVTFILVADAIRRRLWHDKDPLDDPGIGKEAPA